MVLVRFMVAVVSQDGPLLESFIIELHKMYFPSKSIYSIVIGFNLTHSPTSIKFNSGKFLSKVSVNVDRSDIDLPNLELNNVESVS